MKTVARIRQRTMREIGGLFNEIRRIIKALNASTDLNKLTAEEVEQVIERRLSILLPVIDRVMKATDRMEGSLIKESQKRIKDYEALILEEEMAKAGIKYGETSVETTEISE